MNMRTLAAATAVILLALAACGGADEERAEQEPETIGRPTALMINPIHDAQIVRGDDGMDHVEYDLLVISVFAEPVTLSSVIVLGPDGTELLRIEGAALAATTQTLLAKTPSAVVPASAAVAIDVDLIVPPDTAPERVTHRIANTLEDDSKSAAMIDVPVIDGPEVAIDGRRIETAETFAVDWALVKGDKLHDGDGSQNEQFYDFGADVHAVGDGTVVAIQDGKPEQDPTTAMVPESMSDFGGNQVMIEIEPNVFAWYAHLQPGSLKVAVGDVVKAGTVLAKLGNTGPSLGPHLHFGLLDVPDPTAGRSLPFVLDSYTMAGTVDPATSEGDHLVITPESRPIRSAYPLYGGIQDFS